MKKFSSITLLRILSLCIVNIEDLIISIRSEIYRVLYEEKKQRIIIKIQQKLYIYND